MKRGLSLTDISSLLWLSCDFDNSPGYHALAWLRVPMKEKAKEMKRLARRFREDRLATIALVGSEKKSELLAQLETFEKELDQAREQALSQISKRTLNPSIFRAWLIEEVKRGAKQPLFQELSYLIDVAYEAHNQPPPSFGAEALRKAYQRYVAKPPISEFENPEDTQRAVILILVLLVLRAIFGNDADGTSRPDAKSGEN